MKKMSEGSEKRPFQTEQSQRRAWYDIMREVEVLKENQKVHIQNKEDNMEEEGRE